MKGEIVVVEQRVANAVVAHHGRQRTSRLNRGL